MTTYRLLIAIEHTLPNWPLVDFRKKSSLSKEEIALLPDLTLPPTSLQLWIALGVNSYDLKYA